MDMITVVVNSFGAIINCCWRLLNIKVLANTYSLWNVFQGVFAVWAFKIVITDGIMGYAGRTYGRKGNSYGYDKHKNRSNVWRHREVE